jgi:hypothetical protein
VKLLAIFLSCTIFLQSFLITSLAANATAINIETTTSTPASGSVACHKVGMLLLAEGLALINGDEISIQDTSKHAAEHELVTGKIVQKFESHSPKDPDIKGTVFFDRGPALKDLEPHCSEESVELTDGNKIVGHILELNKEICKIAPLSGGTQDLAMSQVAQIHSPRVFKFSIQTNEKGRPLSLDARNIIFEPTCHPIFIQGHIHHKKKLIIAAAILLIATAISCGVAIPLSVHHHHQSPPIRLVFQNPPTPTPIPIPHTRFFLPPSQTPPLTTTKIFIPKGYVVITTGQLRKIPKPPPPPPPRRRRPRG